MGSGSSKAPSALETQRAHALELQDKFSIGEDDEDGTGEDSQPLATADIEADDFSFEPGTQPETTRCEWLSGFFTRKQNAFELGSFDGDVPEQPDCPEPKANILSRVTFSWLDSLMIKGWKKPLEHYDLWKLNPIDRSGTNLNKFSHHWKKDYPNLLLALHHTFGLYFYLAGIIKFFQDCLQFVGPVLLRDLIAYLNDPEASLSYGLWLVTILTGSYIIKTIFVQVYFHMVFRTGMNIRSAVVTTVYNKALRLSPSSRKELSLGQMVDLMSNDCQRLMDICTYLHILWSGPFQILVSIFLLWRIIGVSTLFGVALMLLLIPANGYAMRKITKVRKEAMVFTDERVRWMNEILQGMKAIKLYAYETRLIRMVLAIRDQELKRLRTQKLIRAANNILSYTSPLFVSIVSLGAYAIINGGISSEVAFPAISLFNLLRFPLSMLPEMINQSAEARVSLGRLKHFLTFEEMSDVENDQEPEVDELDRTIRLSVKGNFHWENVEDAPVLTNVNIRIPEGEIMAVVGPVGSGKSALVSSILGETKPSEGSGVRLHGSVALAAQQPWIMNATIRENILFGKPLNEKKYQRVVEACALLPDFQQLPAADMTEIGERGINLSGGQKQRICIARTIYSEADIYIFDDPLSAVDAHVGNHIFEHAISGILKGKTVLLVTHQLQYLPNVDEIVLLGRNGTISGQGSYNTLLQNNDEFIHMIEEHGSMAKQQEDATQDASIISVPEDEATQELSKSTSSKEIAIQKGDTVSVPISTGNDKGKLVEKEERGIGAVQFKMYVLYVMAAGSKFIVFTILLCYVLSQLTRIGTDWWVAYWSDQTDNAAEGSDEHLFYYLSIYCAWGLVNALIVTICSFCVAFTTIRCSKVIHERLLFRIMNGPLSFFETTPLGRILNRFSKDQDTVDVQLADSLFGYVNILVVCSGTLLLMVVVLPLTLTFLIPLIAIYYLVQLYYRSTSRELKRLESISKSPIFAHFSETLGGLTTIRAYNAQGRFSVDNENKLDHNQEAYFAMVSSNRWLGIRLDFIASFVVLAAALFSILDHTMDPSLAGLVLSYAFSTTGWMSWLVRSTAEVEQNMNSIERINFYSNIEQESSSGTAANANDDISLHGRRSDLPEASDAEKELLMSESEQSSRASIWPINGDIEFSNVVLHYRADIERPALNNLSFSIRGGEKIGVCGRTGAGKSSLLTAIFRIVELTSGQIKVDGIDISQMDLRYLRSHLAIIPQDPVLFSGSLRFNLDPFEEFSDDDIWVALRTVELEQVIRDLPDQLSHKVAEMGSGFSVGQRQLLSFARAILRHQKILFLDEATASCDIITDQLIQRTLREKFKDYTVVTIAHRLNTIFDYDRILVMSDGRVAEFDTPSNLLGNPSSVFYSMVQETNSALSSSSSSSSPSPSPLPVM